MSRSGYSDDVDNWDQIRWRGQVASAIRGKRGQKLLRELAEGMDAMLIKELIKDELQDDNGAVCALGVVGEVRGIDMDALAGREEEDGGNNNEIARAFDIAVSLAAEIQFVNDDYDREYCTKKTTPAERWTRVRKWVAEHLRATSERAG